MSLWSTHALGPAPSDAEARRLWMQHAAGFIMFHDIGEYARSHIDVSLSPEAQQAAEQAINDALYGLMMVANGVTGGLHNDHHTLKVRVVVMLEDDDTIIDSLDLFDGDGACMGYHLWKANDFGEDPVAIPRRSAEAP